MDQILPPELTDLELEALRQIAVHPATRHIPYRVQSRLKDIGYAKEVLGGLVLTDDGLQRVTIDRERAPQARCGRLSSVAEADLPLRKTPPEEITLGKCEHQAWTSGPGVPAWCLLSFQISAN